MAIENRKNIYRDGRCFEIEECDVVSGKDKRIVIWEFAADNGRHTYLHYKYLSPKVKQENLQKEIDKTITKMLRKTVKPTYRHGNKYDLREIT